MDPFWLWGSNDVIGPLVLALGGVIETERRRRGERGLNWSTPPFPSLSIVQDCTNLTSRLAYYFLARKLVRASCNIFIFILGNQLRTASSVIDLASKGKKACVKCSYSSTYLKKCCACGRSAADRELI